MFWKSRRQKVQARAQAAAGDAAKTVTDLAEKTLVIGPTGVALLVGATLLGAAATYVVAKQRKKKRSSSTEE